MPDPEVLSSDVEIPFVLHPRVFAALGRDLITNDIVAVIELVKNSYDAMATRVDVRIRQNAETSASYIEIEDDGVGMSESVIREAWCVIATPYRLSHPASERGRRVRRASGEKGLGRLSAARLGGRLELITCPSEDTQWYIDLSWDDLVHAENMEKCKIVLKTCPPDKGLSHRGTLIRISNLYTQWNEKSVQELRENLSRLTSPFSKSLDFQIWLTTPKDQEAEPTEIRPAAFLAQPPYLVRGRVSKSGRLKLSYRYSTSKSHREEEYSEVLWTDDDEAVRDDYLKLPEAEAKGPQCGPFEFEIRVWDIDKDSIQDISQRFDASKDSIRANIRSYQGISVYRDNVLVLPKSESARDWLGLDLRRVSRIGLRISTSQVVGYVAIQGKENEDLKDTSDRERIEDNPASRDFKKLLLKIVAILEYERGRDRQETTDKEPPFHDLFAMLSAKDLFNQASTLAAAGKNANEIIPLIEQYDTELQKNVEKIEHRLIYYSRLASLGTIAGMLVHEVRNQTLTIGGLTNAVRALIDKRDPAGASLEGKWDLAEKAIRALERMADRFAPLASRTTRTRRRDSMLRDIVQSCIAMRDDEIRAKNVDVKVRTPAVLNLAVDPGDLSTILLNVIDNALYWLSYEKKDPREIRIFASVRAEGTRAYIQVDDSGPGVRSGDEERIFWPGVTRRPEGIGMGLTVASEIVASHGGNMTLIAPGFLGGASFGFDLPVAGEQK